MIQTTTNMILYVTNCKDQKKKEEADEYQATDSDRSREYIALQ